MKHFEAFMDNWFLPVCLVVISGWLTLRQNWIFDEHEDMLKRLAKLESNERVIDTKIDFMAENQKEIKDNVKEILHLLQSPYNRGRNFADSLDSIDD